MGRKSWDNANKRSIPLAAIRNFLSEKRYRIIRIALMTIAILFVCEIAARIYFSRPDIVIRNSGNNDQAMQYLLEQLHRYKGQGERVVFLGSSVMQGYINAYDNRTFPSMAQNILRKKYGFKKLKTFNMGVAGNHFADNLCVLNQVLKEKPDAIMHAIHFKLFSTHRARPITRESNIYYLRGHPKFHKYFKRFNISPKKYVAIYLDKKIGELFKLYGHKDLITHLVTGAEHVAMEQVDRSFQETFGFLNEEALLARIHKPEDHNQEYLWKLLPKPLLKQNYEICGNFNFTDTNDAWLNFRDENKLARQNNQTIQWYFTPMNRAFVEERNFFNWRTVIPVYKDSVYSIVRQYKHQLLDYSLSVDTANFSDTDHITMNGHKQVARRAAKDINKFLKKKRRGRR